MTRPLAAALFAASFAFGCARPAPVVLREVDGAVTDDGTDGTINAPPWNYRDDLAAGRIVDDLMLDDLRRGAYVAALLASAHALTSSATILPYDPYEIAGTLNIGSSIAIEIDTGKVTLAPGVKPDAAAREFWAAVEQLAPCKEKHR